MKFISLLKMNKFYKNYKLTCKKNYNRFVSNNDNLQF